MGQRWNARYAAYNQQLQEKGKYSSYVTCNQWGNVGMLDMQLIINSYKTSIVNV